MDADFLAGLRVTAGLGVLVRRPLPQPWRVPGQPEEESFCAGWRWLSAPARELSGPDPRSPGAVPLPGL